MRRLGFALVALLMPVIARADDWYGVATIGNTTSQTVYFVGQYSGGDPEPKRIQPGEAVGFWHRYNYPNEHQSPTLTISFPSKGVWKTRTVTRCGTATNDEPGYRYNFQYPVGGGVELYSTGDGGAVSYVN